MNHPLLIAHPGGRYHFLRGIEPYSCGVVASPGSEIIRITPDHWLPWREGFDFIEAFLQREGLDRAALCALELRSPEPFSMAGFIEFNSGYCATLESWGLLLDGLNPVARTNIAPVDNPPPTPSLHAFSFVRPQSAARHHGLAPTFVVAGAGELRDALLDSDHIVRRGETSPAALLEKAAYVLDVMEERLHGLGVDWPHVTASDVYTAHPIDEPLRASIQRRLGPAARHGFCSHFSRPPVLEIEFEMDLRGPRCERSVTL